MPDLIKNYVMLGLGVLVVVFGLAAFEYKRLYKATDLALQTQNKAIDAQNKRADAELKQAKAERDAKQAELDKRAQAQEKTDDSVVKQVDAARAADASAPVRVRYITRYSGSCDPRPGSAAAADAQAGGADAGTTTGVLAPAAQGRFDDTVRDIEILQAAYNSCRSTGKK